MNSVVLAPIGELLLVACLIAMVSRKVGLPYSVGLVGAGLLIALVHDEPQLSLSRDLIFNVLLPPLVFEAAMQLPWKEFRRELPVTLTLAFVGVGLAAGVVAAAFRTPKDSAGQTPDPTTNGWIVFRVTDITVPPVDLASDEMKKLKENLQRAEVDELLRISATASGIATSAACSRTPIRRAAAMPSGRQASELRVLNATTCTGSSARANAPSGARPATIATG